MFKYREFNQWVSLNKDLIVGHFGLILFVLFVLIAWSVIWKGIALWKAARNNDLGWFIIFLFVNTVGILEIFYIYVFRINRENKDMANKESGDII